MHHLSRSWSWCHSCASYVQVSLLNTISFFGPLTVWRHVQCSQRHWCCRAVYKKCFCCWHLKLGSLRYFRCCRFLRWQRRQRPRHQDRPLIRWPCILCLCQLTFMLQPHQELRLYCLRRSHAWILCRHCLVGARRNHDVVSTGKTQRPIYIPVLDYLQFGHCHRQSGKLKSFKIKSNYNSMNVVVSDGTYIGFIVLTFVGACLSWILVDAK